MNEKQSKASKVVRPTLLKALVGNEQAEAIMNKIGTYKMAPGGGKPLAKGQKAPSAEWVANNRKMQPRAEDGTFTYNSANALPLAPSSEPFRGKGTVPPFLLGKSIKFAKKADGKTTLIANGKRYITDLNLTKEAFLDEMKLAAGVEKLIQKEGGELKGKVGRPSIAEKEAIASGVTGVFMGDFADFAKKYTGGKKVIAFKKKTPAKEESKVESKPETKVESPSTDSVSTDIDNLFKDIFGE